MERFLNLIYFFLMKDRTKEQRDEVKTLIEKATYVQRMKRIKEESGQAEPAKELPPQPKPSPNLPPPPAWWGSAEEATRSSKAALREIKAGANRRTNTSSKSSPTARRRRLRNRVINGRRRYSLR